MPRLFVLLVVLIVASVMALTQHFALINYWYWEYWWLDILMHIGGGVVVGLMLVVLGVRKAFLIIIGTFAIGVSWELFEITIGITRSEPNTVFDTSLDLLMDILGAVLAYGIIRIWSPKSLSLLHAEPGVSPDRISL